MMSHRVKTACPAVYTLASKSLRPELAPGWYRSQSQGPSVRRDIAQEGISVITVLTVVAVIPAMFLALAAVCACIVGSRADSPRSRGWAPNAADTVQVGDYS